MVAIKNEPSKQVVIVGAGIVGLTLGLALESLAPRIKVEIYEKVESFHDEVGAGMGLYPNGLRVLRLISPDLLESIRKEGYGFLLRRIERHDGTEVVVGDESILSMDSEDSDLHSIGIRRWKLLRALHETAIAKGIPIHFGKKVTQIWQTRDDGPIEVEFNNGSAVRCDILFGADGSKSRIRELVTDRTHKLKYNGVTCLMGIAEHGRESRGICFPAAKESKSHGCYFPTGEEEQCFQVNLPVPPEQTSPGSWGTLSEKVGQKECRDLANRLRNEGWDDRYVTPLEGASHAVRIGFCSLQPPMERWVFGNRIVLLGDAAHPPVPYSGQGAQMGLEDAGCIALLIKKLCFDSFGAFQLDQFAEAMRVYEMMRIPRVADINQISAKWGDTQQMRATCEKRNRVSEERMRRDVFFHQTLSHLFEGVNYDIEEEVDEATQQVSF